MISVLIFMSQVKAKNIINIFDIIENTKGLTNLFDNQPIKGIRRLPNHRDQLISAKI